jgi:hypothetical protein
MKSKRSTKIKLKPYANRTHDYKITINDNKEDEKVVICHKSTSDKGALTRMCGRDEKP